MSESVASTERGSGLVTPVRALKPRWGLFWTALAIFFAWVGVMAWMYFKTRAR